MNCDLCGYEFSKARDTKCSGCGKLHSCNKQCCPNCGYELVKETKVIKLIRSLFK